MKIRIIFESKSIAIDSSLPASPKKEDDAGLSPKMIIHSLIEAEETAIKQYEEALKIEELKPFSEIINHILKEEKEHKELLEKVLEKLSK